MYKIVSRSVSFFVNWIQFAANNWFNQTLTVSSWGNRRLKFSQETLRIDIYVRVTGWCCSRCNAYTLICITWLDNNSCVPIISLTQELNPSILCLVTRSHAKVTGYLGVKLPKFKIYNLLLKDDIATIFFFLFIIFVLQSRGLWIWSSTCELLYSYFLRKATLIFNYCGVNVSLV